MGLPYAFASHFAPAYFKEAVHYYRVNFQPSVYLEKPFVISCINVFVADEEQEAHRLATSFYRMALGIIRKTSEPLKPAIDQDKMKGIWSIQEAEAIQQMMTYTFIGSLETVQNDLNRFLNSGEVDEVMVTSGIYDHQARLRSYELLAKLF